MLSPDDVPDRVGGWMRDLSGDTGTERLAGAGVPPDVAGVPPLEVRGNTPLLPEEDGAVRGIPAEGAEDGAASALCAWEASVVGAEGRV